MTPQKAIKAVSWSSIYDVGSCCCQFCHDPACQTDARPETDLLQGKLCHLLPSFSFRVSLECLARPVRPAPYPRVRSVQLWAVRALDDQEQVVAVLRRDGPTDLAERHLEARRVQLPRPAVSLRHERTQQTAPRGGVVVAGILFRRGEGVDDVRGTRVGVLRGRDLVPQTLLQGQRHVVGFREEDVVGGDLPRQGLIVPRTSLEERACGRQQGGKEARCRGTGQL